MLLLPNELLLMLTRRRVVLRTNNIWVSHSLNILINEICNVESMLSLEILCCHKTIFAAQKKWEESPLTDQLFFVWLKYFLMTVLLTWWCWCWHKSPCSTLNPNLLTEAHNSPVSAASMLTSTIGASLSSQPITVLGASWRPPVNQSESWESGAVWRFLWASENFCMLQLKLFWPAEQGWWGSLVNLALKADF